VPTNAQKTITDAGYIAVGLGVMGFQQAQIRARAARERVAQVGGCVAGRARDVRTAFDSQTQSAQSVAEAQVRNTVARAGALRSEVEKRVQPVVGQVQAQLGDLPERVVQAMEPVAARVRELTGNAA
jgi:cell division septum initiation protein DivIVA